MYCRGELPVEPILARENPRFDMEIAVVVASAMDEVKRAARFSLDRLQNASSLPAWFFHPVRARSTRDEQ
jgi:hypothetical protein